MAWYNINKGIGKQVEFKGLRAQYLFIFAGGLLGVFILFVAMYLLGVPTAVCIAAGLVLGTALVAARRHPRRIIHRKRIARLMRTTNDKP